MTVIAQYFGNFRVLLDLALVCLIVGLPAYALSQEMDAEPDLPADVADTGLQEMPVSMESCIVMPTREVSPVARSAIYQWRDENGRMHFSDTPPPEGAQLYESGLPDRLDYFDLRIDYRDSGNVPFLQNQLRTQTTGIYEILSDLVDVELLRRVELNLVILPDRTSYLDYSVDVTGGRLDNTTGFYTNLDNQAVTYRFEETEDTLTVARHEAVHVILYGMLGMTPIWFNEGMAEYFERLSMQNQVSRIEVNPMWIDIARQSIAEGYPDSLVRLLTLSNDLWNAENVVSHYALASTLVYFLMDSDSGRAVLAALMNELAADYCSIGRSATLVNANYPGGVRQLQQAFYAWLNAPDAIRIHRY